MDQVSSGIKKLTNKFLEIKNEKEMENFLLGLLTPKEIIELPMRIRIVELLKKGIPHHEVAEKLGVGVATVTRGANEIKKGRFRNIR